MDPGTCGVVIAWCKFRDAVRDRLDRIQALFLDVKQLQDRYGVVEQPNSDPTPDKVKENLSTWALSLLSNGIGIEEPNQSSDEEGGEHEDPDHKQRSVLRRGIHRRTRWAIRDKDRLKELIALFQAHTNELNQLLTESQYQLFNQDLSRVNMIIIGKLEDDRSLDMVGKALAGGVYFRDVTTLAENKAIATRSEPFESRTPRKLFLEDLNIPEGASTRFRFVATRKSGCNDQYLFEKKPFDKDIFQTDRDTLESRMKRLAALLSSGRSIRSLVAVGYNLDSTSYCCDNILLLDPEDILSATIVGFEYSRQETELQSIDNAKDARNLEHAIYRHPNCQGEAATGYKIHYDIYSFGLVLAKISWWISIKNAMLAAIPTVAPPVKILLKMTTSHRPEAKELQRRVLLLVDGDMSFRARTVYRDVVRWCLGFADKANTKEEEWHPALEFNDRVVVPLESLVRA
ncbi:hypothetical protein K432DRAFT_396936 [Lepidopterella palustris CBS 459.81]|uniref:Prion-inhibition and propagation HeLo domain-containing protein n=1 Tax=Lepidopterella palustris CBS 459.81 TaxID=1314670 RepID=A0A8E2JAW7_9PEZI|nr:hypothetical protein K432DRAFT_396936 [Lepidopterella palustris CBS 459.81]